MANSVSKIQLLNLKHLAGLLDILVQIDLDNRGEK